jgi:hypothetical protein
MGWRQSGGWAGTMPVNEGFQRRPKLASDGGPAGVPKGKRRDTKRRHRRHRRHKKR